MATTFLQYAAMKTLKPEYKEWAAESGTPWCVGFPAGRRFFKTEQLAWDDITTFQAGRPGKLKASEEEEYRMCRDLLSDRSNVRVLDAVRFYVINVPLSLGKTTIATAVADYLKKKEPKVGKAHFDSLKRSLCYFADSVGTKALIDPLIYTTAAAFLNKQAEGTRPQRATHVAAFLRSIEEQAPGAAKKMYEMVELDTDEEAPDPHFLSVVDTATMLHHVRTTFPDWLGAVALKLFTGIRSFEVGRLHWRDVDLEQRIVRIGSDVAKKTRGRKSRRVIDWWPDCLTDWLMLCQRKPEAFVAPETQRIRRHKGGFDINSLAAQRRFVAWTSESLKPAMASLGVDLRKNDLRHTYATYGVANHQNADLIALQMGHHDSRMLFAHYRNWTSQREAKEYFALTPPEAERIYTERTTPQAIQNHG